MAIYQSVNAVPYDSVVDGTLVNNFSCTVQGDGIQYYKFYIYDMSNNTVYNKNGTLSNILYNNDTFTLSVPAATVTNGNTYKWVVAFSSDNSTFVTGWENPFYALKTPILTIDSFSSNMETNKYNFTATYSQEQNVLLKWYQWFLYDAFDNLLQQSDQIWGVNPHYTFSGFINGYAYKIKVIGINQRGVSVESDTVPFTANFDVGRASVNATATVDCTRDSVKLTWPKIRQINGLTTGTTDYENFNILKNYKPCINVLSNAYLEYLTDVEIPLNFTANYITRINNDGDIIQLKYQSTNRNRSLSYFIGRFYYLYDNTTVEQFYIIQHGRAMLLGLRPDNVYIRQFNMQLDGGDSTTVSNYDYSFDGGDSTNTNEYRFVLDAAEKEAILLSGYGATNFTNAELVPAGGISDFSNSELLQSGGIDVYYMNT